MDPLASFTYLPAQLVEVVEGAHVEQRYQAQRHCKGEALDNSGGHNRRHSRERDDHAAAGGHGDRGDVHHPLPALAAHHVVNLFLDVALQATQPLLLCMHMTW